MTLTPKESSLLKDLKKQEQLCIDKYTKYAQQACDPQLSDLFTQIADVEREHLQTLETIEQGKTPQMNAASGKNKQPPAPKPSACSRNEQDQDKFLCNDLLSTEKYVSADYNTCIFEFTDTKVREALNHIQKEEQQHGEQIYNYMAVNGMYQ